VSPDRFKTVVGVLLAVLVLVALSPWSWVGGSDASTPTPGQYPPDHVPPGYYPPAPSTAVGMTPEWRAYAANVDRTCAVSFNYALALQARTNHVARAEGWSQPRWEEAVVRLWSQEDGRIHRATARMGPPPARPVLFARWRRNVARRTALFAQASRVSGQGRFDAESRILHRIDRLKARSDRIGQRFGLRICTSN
jgi:hypothetical protein